MYLARNLEDALENPLETGELYLSGRGLTDFPMEVFHLPNLKVLDLSQNLVRQLPDKIGELEHLQVLNLRNNQLRQIPAEIGQLQQLQRLDLEENQLALLPTELADCLALRDIRLNDNSFAVFPDQAFHNQLQNLTLGFNQLTLVPESIRHLTALKYLDLRHNRLHKVPNAFALLENLETILLKGNPLELAVNATDPEGLLERFFRELKTGKSTKGQSKYSQRTRISWLNLVQGSTEAIEDEGLAANAAALDSPMAIVREAARSMLPQIFPSPLPKSGEQSLLLAGQFPTIQKAETERALQAAGFQVLKRLIDTETIVILGERPGAMLAQALEKGNPIGFEGHLVNWLAAAKGEFLNAAPTTHPMHENLGRLIRSYKKENIEIALMMMSKAGAPANLLTDLLAIRLFHPEPEVKSMAGNAFTQLADKQVHAFTQRQITQNYKEEEFYDVQALVAALIRNSAFDAATLVKAAMDLKGAGAALIFLTPQSEHAQLLQNHLKDGQLNLAGIGLSEFPASLFSQRGLRYLMLSRNQLAQLPENLEAFAALEMLDLAENQLIALPESIGELKKLTGLDLSQNRLKHLPETIGNMLQLEALRLDRNPLQSLPSSLPGLKNLEMLGLFGCKFGELPSVVWELSQLRALDLGENNLAALPLKMNGFDQLESLGLRDNPIQDLPAWIGQLPALRFLDLSYVQARTLPLTMFGHSRLERIYLLREDSMDWEQVLPILASMPRLRHVYLRGRKIVRPMQLHIEAQLPKVRVLFN
jgi:Leucine-rich repeat (LRR) protein